MADLFFVINPFFANGRGVKAHLFAFSHFIKAFHVSFENIPDQSTSTHLLKPSLAYISECVFSLHLRAFVISITLIMEDNWC